MKAEGNGLPEICAENLFQIVRGEVPMDRQKGIDGNLIDRPGAEDELLDDAEQLINEYEERVTVNNVEICGNMNGNTVITANFTDAEYENGVDEYE